MKLHIFNPEHDIALANRMNIFTAPHAVRELRADLGFLPALWAADGDIVLVDDVQAALDAVRHLRRYAHDVLFVNDKDLAAVPIDFSAIEVAAWGWDEALKHRLLAISETFAAVVPTTERLYAMSRFSNRKFAAEILLPRLVPLHERLVGRSLFFDGKISHLTDLLKADGERFVLKAPWSSSGRGLRYVNSTLTGHEKGWCSNLIKQQGGIMIEPYYRKIKDFGMEFLAHPDGTIRYLGLSLFSTVHGAYAGNLLATETTKKQILSRYIPTALLDLIKDNIVGGLSSHFKDQYQGPFGVDMMVVAMDNRPELCVHPCVEINLRMTMGHVAIALSAADPLAPKRQMSIMRTDKYRLKISNVGDDLLIPYSI